MKRNVIASGVLLSLVSMQAWCNESATAQSVSSSEEVPAVVQEPGFQYFVGLRGGGNLLGNADSASISSGSIDSDDGDYGVFGGLDLGVYMPNDRGRVYYSFEYHSTTTKFDGQDAYDTNVGLHLLSLIISFAPTVASGHLSACIWATHLQKQTQTFLKIMKKVESFSVFRPVWAGK